ncbi:MAG: M20 metallopeptidase family protein, partial [Methanobacteriaceae archaeon]
LHQHPELAYQELQTGQFVIDYLEKLPGVELTYPIAKTGIKAVLNNEIDGPAVALRADFDALPVKEETGLSYASTVKTDYNGQETYVAHVCGHDANSASALGTAMILCQLRDRVKGKVVFLFQPAEEGVPLGMESGAELMVKEGALENPKVKAIFGLHPYSKDYPGTVLFSKGTTHASLNDMVIKIRGVQAHGSQPWISKDPILAGAAIINALQTIISREVDLMKGAAVITVGYFHAGIKNNIIPENAEMGLTIRSLDEFNRQLLLKRVSEVAKLTAQAHGCQIKIIPGQHDPMNRNHPQFCQTMLTTIHRVAGAENVKYKPATTGSEDFSYFSQEVPSLYLHYGSASLQKPLSESKANHHPQFLVDETAIKFATRLECNLIYDAILKINGNLENIY